MHPDQSYSDLLSIGVTLQQMTPIILLQNGLLMVTSSLNLHVDSRLLTV